MLYAMRVIRSERTLGTVLLGAVLACGAFLAVAADGGSAFPTDAKVMALFAAKRLEFVTLARMINEDHADYYWSSGLSDKITGERRQAYLRLLATLPPMLSVTTEKSTGTVKFILVGTGTSAVGSGTDKGIEYIPGDPSEIGVVASDLDHADEMPADLYLRQIEPHWFIEYERFE
jgi:hypothetical protein